MAGHRAPARKAGESDTGSKGPGTLSPGPFIFIDAVRAKTKAHHRGTEARRKPKNRWARGGSPGFRSLQDQRFGISVSHPQPAMAETVLRLAHRRPPLRALRSPISVCRGQI